MVGTWFRLHVVNTVILFCGICFLYGGIFGRSSPGCGSHGGNVKHQESAREILDKRFAKGEITKHEYEEMKRTLENETK